MEEPEATMTLLDYRRRVSDLYGEIRRRGPGRDTWVRWRGGRDALFRHHPQSPYPPGARAELGPLPYFDYDPAFAVTATVQPAAPATFEIAHSSDGTTPARRFGRVAADLPAGTCELSLYWLDVYGGGVFLPFRDTTAGDTTYGGGRYLLDTAKSADLGTRDGALILDFNFAYHPSCYHDPRWSCPLAPPENRVDVAIEAGERVRGQ